MAQARRVAGTALDVIFEARSKLPAVPEGFFAEAGSEPILLPPPHTLLSGNQSTAGLMHLVMIGRLVGARHILEIGTYNGATAMTLAANLPAVVETLDLPSGEEPVFEISQDDRANAAGFPHRLYEGTEWAPRIHQHLGDSASFDFAALGGPFDLVYVDGAHTIDYVSNDTRVAFSNVSSSGAVVWDDYWRRVPDVAACLHRIHDRSIFRIPGTRLAVWFADREPRSHASNNGTLP